MQKIIPHLWFDKEAEEAAQLYVSLFSGSKIGTTTRYTDAGHEIHGQPAGRVMTVGMELAGLEFVALNGGPLFHFNPSVSFLVACETKEEVDRLWAELSKGGGALMELGAYPFSERYGWTTDRFGLSWQVMFMGDRPIAQKITPTIMFVGDQAGRAEEAMKLYASVLGGGLGDIMRYPEGMAPEKPGTVMHGAFTLAGQGFAAMDSAQKHEFAFNEAISFLVRCDSQEEIDRLWQALAANPAEGQCGWLHDRFGLSWQISPVVLEDMMQDPDPKKVERVTNAFLKMKKFDIAELERAFNGA